MTWHLSEGSTTWWREGPAPAPPPYTACSLKLVLDRRSLIVSRGTHSVPPNGTHVIRGSRVERLSRAIKLRLASPTGLFIRGQEGHALRRGHGVASAREGTAVRRFGPGERDDSHGERVGG